MTQLNEIRYMVDFIEQEAEEKAEEIDVRTDEEFKQEKKNHVKKHKQIIDKQFFAMEKQIGMQHKTERSSIINRAKLQLLQKQQQLLSSVLDETKKRLAEVVTDDYRHRALMMSLILEGLLILIEPIVIIKVKEADRVLVEALIPILLKKYREKTGSDRLQIFIDETYLKDSVGGVEMYNRNRKIKITNTLDERLNIVSEKMLPKIRKKLFTVNVGVDFIN